MLARRVASYCVQVLPVHTMSFTPEILSTHVFSTLERQMSSLISYMLV